MTVIHNVNVIDMTSPIIKMQQDVRVNGGKIIAIAPSIEKRKQDKAVKVIDGTGHYLMPALFDAHAHLNSSEMAKLFIANGITSIRHLSGGNKVMAYVKQIKEGQVIGPDVYASSPIYDGQSAPDKSPTYRYIGSVEEAIQAVDDSIKEGYQWVKTYASILPEHLKALMDRANEKHIKVCGHMSYHVDHKTLCDWGYHCCEHSSSLPRDDAAIQYLAEKGMWFCPTQVVCETLPDYGWNGKKLTDLDHYDYVPQKVKAFWESRNEKILKRDRARMSKPDINQVIKRGMTFMAYSDRVMAGTDTMFPGIIAGFSLHEELEKLVSLYHQSPFKVLKMATCNPCEYAGVSAYKGYVLEGYDSDLILLSDNPLEDIRATQSIKMVIKGDQFYDRQALDDLLWEVKNEPAVLFEELF